MRYQPRFGAATLVLVVLTILAVLTRVLDPLIVPETNPRLAAEEAPTLKAAAVQRISWYALSPEAFEEARREEKPILLVVSEPWSLMGRQYDEDVFSSITVDKFLARAFVCIRIDGVENPDWIAAYTPYSRVRFPMLPDFQIWVLDSEGKVYKNVSPNALGGQPSDNQFSDQLTAVLKLLGAASSQQNSAPADLPGALQFSDVSQIGQGSGAPVPNLDTVNRTFRDFADKTGGFQFTIGQRIWPMAWLYLLEANNPSVAAEALSPMLRSPTRDLLDGGFFLGSTTSDWRRPAYDKPAVLNAEMASLLAKLSIAMNDPTLRRMAEETFDSLTGEFLDSDGLIRPCRIGDETTELDRSKRSSFGEHRMRDLLSESPNEPAFSTKGVVDYFKGKDVEWAIKNLGLDPRQNPQMTPFLRDPAIESSPEYARVLSKLRAAAAPSTFDDQTTLACAGASVARLIETARLLNDPKRLNKALDIAAKLERFRRTNEVTHVAYASARARPVLADALAYADAALQSFLSLGRVEDLENGSAVLNQALIDHAGGESGVYLSGAGGDVHASAPDSNVAQVGDDAGESDAARLIRLCWSYGTLLAHADNVPDRLTSQRLMTAAKLVLARFADLGPNLGPYGGGYACAAALLDDDTMILCAGMNPAAMVAKMAPMEPLRVVAPVVGQVYPKLFAHPGYYLVRHGNVIGPYDAPQVVGMLPSTLVMGG